MVAKHWMPWLVTIGVSFVLTVGGCTDSNQLEGLQRSGELVVLTRNAATTYYENRAGNKAGLEYDLVRAFASHLDVNPRFKVYDTTSALLEALEDGEGHIAAAGLTPTKKLKKKFLFSSSYQNIQQQVLCHRDAQVETAKDLTKMNLRVQKDSSHEGQLKQLKKKLPELTWETTEAHNTESLIRQVYEGKIDCTVADSNIVAVHNRYFPNVEIVFPLTTEQELAWALPKDQKWMKTQIDKWLVEFRKEGQLEAMIDHYYGYTQEYNYYDIQVFLKRIQTRLPELKPIFKKAAKLYNFDWKFLAAVAYQESHWDRLAESPTGVEGIMMLTRDTAKLLGVTNRVDIRQSIMGGARYLRKMIQKVPSFITHPHRKWMGVAAYNVGFGHLKDARSLAVLKHKNPNHWPPVKSVLPLLTKPRYYKKLPHGYARGHEPVVYVERIRNYYDILKNDVHKRDQDVKELLATLGL